MKVTVQYFSRLREVAGHSQREVELADGAAIADLLQTLYLECPALQKWDPHLLLAVGLEFVSREQRLRDRDVVSLMPPVQGG